MAQVFYASEADAQILRKMAEDYRRRIGNTTGRGRRDGIEDEESNAPETYIARTPFGGLPGLSRGDTGTGSTLTDDAPGQADCAIYRIIDGPLLEPVDGLERTVYNVTEQDVPADKWIVVLRDKFGSWLFLPGPLGITINWTGQRTSYCDGTDLYGVFDRLEFTDGVLTHIEEDVTDPGT